MLHIVPQDTFVVIQHLDQSLGQPLEVALDGQVFAVYQYEL